MSGARAPDLARSNGLRAYLQDSPPAAVRIVALTMLCDGHLSKVEVDAVQARELCEDLLAATGMSRHANCRIDAHMLALADGEVQVMNAAVEQWACSARF